MHTEGPWELMELTKDGDVCIAAIDDKGNYVAICTAKRKHAGLLATAPELLDALKAIVRAYEITDTGTVERYALQTIAKAEGK